jgi:farnesyl diphosphate synthase
VTSTAEVEFEAALAELARQADQALDRLLHDGASARLLQAVRYAALGPGKRLRPFLVLQGAKLFEVDPLKAMRAAAALECVHCYSLVHDDLPAMDDDDLRRGRPTVHRQFDEATAILAGDSLLTVAFEILAAPATHGDGEVRSRLVLELARASGMSGMVAGQMLDIEAETGRAGSLAEITTIQSLKTGALFRFACEAGAIMAGQDRRPLRQYADDIGVAFQIADDLLDLESTPEAVGKATQKDQGRGKATFVDLLGRGGARKEAALRVERAIDALSGYGEKADLMRAAARFIIARKK